MTMKAAGEEPVEFAWTERSGADRLSVFMDRMRRNWGLAAGVVAGCVAVAGILAFTLPSYWRVETVVMPVSKNSTGNLNIGALTSGLGALGALIGRPSSTQDEALAVLRSRELFDTYAKQQNLLPILFSSKWNAGYKRWDVSPSRIPTLRQGYRLFNNSIRNIDEDRRTGIVTMGITWKDRALAAKWARDLIDLTNSQLRERAVAEALQNMRYLSEQMRSGQGTSASNALNVALASAYERQLQDYMFAKGQQEFAFRIVDPPTIPDERERVWPQRPLLLALGFILGVILAIGAVYLRELLRGRQGAGRPLGVSRVVSGRA